MNIEETVRLYRKVKHRRVEELTPQELAAKTYGDLMERKKNNFKKKRQLIDDLEFEKFEKYYKRRL